MHNENNMNNFAKYILEVKKKKMLFFDSVYITCMNPKVYMESFIITTVTTEQQKASYTCDQSQSSSCLL